MIIEVIVVSRDSNSTRKSYAHSIGACSIKKKTRLSQNITFGDDDLTSVESPHDDVLVVIDNIANFDVKKVLVDGDSATNVLTWRIENLSKIINTIGLF